MRVRSKRSANSILDDISHPRVSSGTPRRTSSRWLRLRFFAKFKRPFSLSLALLHRIARIAVSVSFPKRLRSTVCQSTRGRNDVSRPVKRKGDREKRTREKVESERVSRPLSCTFAAQLPRPNIRRYYMCVVFASPDRRTSAAAARQPPPAASRRPSQPSFSSSTDSHLLPIPAITITTVIHPRCGECKEPSPTPSTTRQTASFSPSDQQVYRNNETGVTRNIMENIDLLELARRSIGSFFLKLRCLCFAMLENKTRSERKEGKVSRFRVSRG